MSQLLLQRPIVRQTLPNINVVYRTKIDLSNLADSNDLLPYLTHQLGSAREWSGVWNGP